jgi:hypothetical protein
MITVYEKLIFLDLIDRLIFNRRKIVKSPNLQKSDLSFMPQVVPQNIKFMTMFKAE